jgi:hypothetical protein
MNNKMVKLGEKTNLTKEDMQKFTKIGLSGLIALALSVFTVGWSDSNAAEVKTQPGKDKVKPSSERCNLKPESGSCKAMLDRYYYDAATNTCKRFTYGGCDGVAPFETMAECRKACLGERPYPVSKYGAVGIRDFKDAK